ncbi:MAG: alpha/beta hydrolase fold domain-containing protein [Acidimicrobiales bacterium]
MTARSTARPGRFGDPDVSPATDPRIDRDLRSALALFELDGRAEPAPVDRSAGLDAITEFVAASDAGFNELYDIVGAPLPGEPDIKPTLEVIGGVDGNDINVWVFRPPETDGPVPGVIYLHGGGMVILRTDAPVHIRWCQALAAAGVVAILPDFRNAWTPDGLNPFPAGLNDCASALDWAHANRDRLGLSSLVVQGESGGGNLSLATALKAKREGRLDAIDGVYACVPYISGGYGWDEDRRTLELPSTVENDGIFLACTMMDLLAAVYTPGGEEENPLAWPYFATVDDLTGLPPHVITVNELDPLRDEGIAYFRRLQEAGVPVVGRVNLGLVHGAELIFRQALPGAHRSAVDDIASFARSR